MTSPLHRRLTAGIAVPLCLLLFAACGSRVDGAQIVAESGGGTVSLTPESLAELRGLAGPAPAEQTASVPQPSGQTQVDDAVPAGAQAVARTETRAPGPATERRAAPAKAAAAPLPAEVAAQCPANLPPITLGHVGTFSGVAGPLTAAAPSTIAAWASEVNSRGGLACHPVRVFSRDDAGDPGRAASVVKDLVARQGVVAFVGSIVPLSGAGFVPAVESVKVPAIGGGSGTQAWFNSPWIFPDGASPNDQITGFIKHGVERGKKKLGVLYCVEAAACTQGIKAIRDGAAKAAGAELLYDAPVSITQPDYTAQCLNAQKAGVDQLALGMDGASVTRLARSCDSVGYRPLLSTVAGLISPNQAKDETMRAFGVVTATAIAPWTENDRPGLKEYHRVLAKWAPATAPDGASVLTWSSAKLLEAAMAKVEDRARRGPVTAALIIDGLGAVRNETLGGLTAPLNFSAGQQGATSNGCVFYLLLDAEGWSAPRGSKPVCLRR